MTRTLPIYGAICGNIIGSRFERGGQALLTLRGYPLVAERCKPNDDTVLTIGVKLHVKRYLLTV